MNSERNVPGRRLPENMNPMARELKQRIQSHNSNVPRWESDFPAGMMPALNPNGELASPRIARLPRIARRGHSAVADVVVDPSMHDRTQPIIQVDGKRHFTADSAYDAAETREINPGALNAVKLLEGIVKEYIDPDPNSMPLNHEEMMSHIERSLDEALGSIPLNMQDAEMADKMTIVYSHLTNLKRELRGIDNSIILRTVGQAIDDIKSVY